MPQAAFRALVADTPRRLLRANLCMNAEDPKLPTNSPVLYAVTEDRERALKACGGKVEVKSFDLAEGQDYFLREDAWHGLLYLPWPYLVPGGRFNEMYGWDAAFAVFAWADTHPGMMREQVDNQLYQIRAYGKVLNANRTYFLSRSQPPLLAAMVSRIWRAAQGRDWKDFDPEGLYEGARAWLAAAYSDLQLYHAYWVTGDRLAGDGALSRYWDDGDGPAIEVVSGEAGHYDHARDHFLQAPDARFFDPKTGALTPLYYRADRAMRASGFDPTGHWGYGGLECIFHAPLCLNSLLYRMEGDMAAISRELSDRAAPAQWQARQRDRLSAMRRLLLDPETGVYQDYDFDRKIRNKDPFATFFHALWAGIYDDDLAAARRAAEACLLKLETPYGISTSTRFSGSQWDHPYGWPPLQYFAFEGLSRCGLQAEARRIAQKYTDLALSVYAVRGSLFEKYNVAEGNAEIRVVHGYSENVSESGTFLWTAATLKLAQDLLERPAA